MLNSVFVLVLSHSNNLLSSENSQKFQNHSKGFMLHSVTILQFSYDVLLLLFHNEKSIQTKFLVTQAVSLGLNFGFLFFFFSAFSHKSPSGL